MSRRRRSEPSNRPTLVPAIQHEVIQWPGARMVVLRNEDVHVMWDSGLMLHVLRRDGVLNGIWAIAVPPSTPGHGFIGPAVVGSA